MAFNWLKIGQNGLQMANIVFKWPKSVKMAFNWLKIGQNGLQLAQNGLQLAQNRLQMAKIVFKWPKSVKMAFNWLKIGQNAPVHLQRPYFGGFQAHPDSAKLFWGSPCRLKESKVGLLQGGGVVVGLLHGGSSGTTTGSVVEPA